MGVGLGAKATAGVAGGLDAGGVVPAVGGGVGDGLVAGGVAPVVGDGV